MALGPFISYAPPGVYTRTLSETNASNLVAGLRIPALIGVGQEELEQNDFEIVRGSSSNVDQRILNEDVSESWVVDDTNPNNLILGEQDGTLSTFQVRNNPIVDGQGFGLTTNDVRSVSVTVNGDPVSLGAVQGSQGLVTLQVPTAPNDDVRVTYFFHRGDTSFTDDVSQQVTSTNATLISSGYAPFVITANVDDQFIIDVNGTVGTVTLPAGSLTASAIASVINAAAIPNLSVSVFTDNQGLNHLLFTTTIGMSIGNGTANGPLGFSSGTSTNRNRTFRVFHRPIVDGTGGGTITTDTSKVVAKVAGQQVVASSVDGANGTVTLPYAPAPGSSVTIEYWANTWQDTFDYLPNSLVTTVTRCGISPGRNDFIQGTDFVVSNPSTDVSVINWGSSFQVAAGNTAVGSTPFDGPTGAGGQIVGTLIDEKMYLGECTRVTDTSTIPATVSATDYLLPEVPTTGNGRSTPLGLALFNSVANSRQALISNRPDLVEVRTGRTLRDALNRPPVPVVSVDGATRRLTLKTPQPSDYNAYATFYYSRLNDDTFIFTNQVAGPVGTGQYKIRSSSLDADLYQVKFGSKAGLSQIVQWPRGSEQIPDAFHAGGTPVSETVTVTFAASAATNAVYTIKGSAPYSFYSPDSATWTTEVDGGDQTTNLASAAEAVVVSDRVALSGGNITIPAAPDNELNITIDGVDIATISLTPGAATPAAIVGEINTAIDADPAFAPGPNNLASAITIGTDVFFVIRGLTVPGALPAGFDDVSNVSINQGTVESVLGFSTFQSAEGTTGAINKPATLLGTLSGDFNITSGLNDTLNVTVDGIEYTVTLTAGSAVTAATVIADINGVIPGTVASVGTEDNLDQIRLTSSLNTPSSSILIGSGSANAVLGFTENAFASQTLVTAQEVVDSLMATAGFASNAVAYVSRFGSQNYVTIESQSTGTSSSIGFTTTANTAFNVTTGVDITPGTDGDVGEDAGDSFTVTSSNANGSSGTGIPGQTYTDAQTGLRFTVLPASTGNYDPAGTFTLEVSNTFNVSPSVPRYSIGGLELLVSNTVGVAVGDTAVLTTYNPDGTEPSVGDFYFISYRYQKQDFSPQIFQQLKSLEANFGSTSAENRLTLGAYLAILNGATLVICKQVLKQPNTNQASAQSFNAAIDELATPLPGNIKPDIIVPLATDTSVYTHLTSHCEIQSNIRNQAERMGFIGFASGTTATTAQAVARGLSSPRIVAMYPDSSVITLTDELGQQFESIVDGSFFASAVAGAVVSTAVDVATPYTRRRVQGFTRITRILDPVEANQTAVAGITLLEDLDPIIRIRQGLTTDMSSVLTRLPTVIQISDFVQQQSRSILDSFVGTKFLASRTNEVIVSMTGLFRSLVQAEIVGAFTGMTAEINPDDPTVLSFEMYYQPIFPLLYIILTFNLRARV